MRSAILLISILLLTMVSSAAAEDAPAIRPTVLIGCFDGETYPPEYQPNFSSAIADIAQTSLRDAYGDSVDVLEVGDWFFFLDAINMPNVVGAVVSMTVREGGTLNIPAGSIDRLVESFEEGLGLVGIHGPAFYDYFRRISRDVFPVDGDKLAGGKISREGGIITVRHTHEKRADHFITEGAPDSFEAADSFLIYKQSVDGSWFVPEEGSMTTLYVAKIGDIEVPSIVAYERGKGRSVTFTGLKHTDGVGGYEKDRDWYNHSLGLPVVSSLLGRSIVWAVEPLLEASTLEKRIQDSTDHFAERLGLLVPEEEFGPGDEAQLVQGSGVKMAVTLSVSVLLILVIAYFGFIRS